VCGFYRFFLKKIASFLLGSRAAAARAFPLTPPIFLALIWS